MLTVLSYYHGDQEQASELSKWILELGGVKAHSCMVVLCHKASEEGVVDNLRDAFGSVEIIRSIHRDQGWPDSPNRAFDCAARYIQEKQKQPWLWIEPDAIPLKLDWIDRISAEYEAARKRFLGFYVEHAKTVPHMSGVAVYPWFMAKYAPKSLNCVKVAWDVNGASQILPLMHQTELIQHEWKPDTFKDSESLKRLNPKAVIYHQVKDKSLINLLRAAKNPVVATDEAAPARPIPRSYRLQKKQNIASKPRTVEEQERINARMAKARASRFKNQA